MRVALKLKLFVFMANLELIVAVGKQKHTNVIGALYEKMLFALDYFEQSINSTIFYHWCKYTLIPNLKRECVIVMDSAQFHKNKCIQKLLNRHGHRILWLTPCSPDLNPIEKK